MDYKKFLTNKYFWLLTIIFLVGLFLRFYNYADNFFFEFDQARDWRIALNAVENGPGELPLIGSRAGGTFFRLGPIYNYFQYFSMLLFGKAPQVTGYPDLIFSVFAIPLFYLLLREYFKRNISAILVALFSVSLFAIEYSRFAWNPNSIPFFSLLIAWSLLKISKENKVKERWIYIIFLSIGLGTIVQLHSLTLIALPAIAIIYLIWTRTPISWKEAVVGILIIIFLLSPLIINDTLNNYSNISSFFQAINQKEESQKDITVSKKIIKGFYEISRNYSVILGSHEIITKLARSQSSDSARELIKINLQGFDGQKNLFFSFIFIIIFGFIFLKMFISLKQFREKDAGKANFLKLFLIWQGVILIPFIALSFKVDTRHYLMAVFIPYIFLGILLEYMFNKKSQNLKAAMAIFVFLLLVANVWGVKKWFSLVESYKDGNENISQQEFILEPYYSVTLSQINSTVEYLKEDYRQKNKHIRVIARVEYERPINYILQYEKIIPAYFVDPDYTAYGSSYFLIEKNYNPEERSRDLPNKISRTFDVPSYKKFGNLVVSKLEFKNLPPGEHVTKFEEYTEPEDSYQRKYYWKDIIEKIRINY